MIESALSLTEVGPFLVHDLNNALVLLELATEESVFSDAQTKSDADAGLLSLRRVAARLELLSGGYRPVYRMGRLKDLLATVLRESRWADRLTLHCEIPGTWRGDGIAMSLAMHDLIRAQCEATEAFVDIDLEYDADQSEYVICSRAPWNDGARWTMAWDLGQSVARAHRGRLTLIEGDGGWCLRVPLETT